MSVFFRNPRALWVWVNNTRIFVSCLPIPSTSTFIFSFAVSQQTQEGNSPDAAPFLLDEEAEAWVARLHSPGRSSDFQVASILLALSFKDVVVLPSPSCPPLFEL